MESSSSPWLLSTAARVPFLDESEIDFAEDHDGSSSDDAIVLDEQGSDRRRQQYLDHHLLFDPRRHLATLKDPSQNETASSSSTATTSDGTSFSYHPSTIVSNMHHAPRFGHPNHLGLVLSSNPEAPMTYAGGLKQFTLFLFIPFLLWGAFLLLFKLGYGVDRVGCAAGGDVLDMRRMSSSSNKRDNDGGGVGGGGVSRKERKRRILRSWRIQGVFLVASVLIPVVSVIMIQLGLDNVTDAMTELQTLTDDVETLAYRGWNAVRGLQTATRHLLHDNDLVRGILGNVTTNISTTGPNDSIFVTEWCPNARQQQQQQATGNNFSFLVDAFQSVQDDAEPLVRAFEKYLGGGGVGGGTAAATSSSSSSFADRSFMTVVETTQYVDSTIEWFLTNDWILKLLVMMLNVVNFLLLLSVYCLSKNNVIHEPTRAYLAWVLVPLLVALTGSLLIVSLTAGVTALVNADFCTGGPDPGSPQGTLEDAILSVVQYGNLDRSSLTQDVNGTMEHTLPGVLGLAYEAVGYYSSGCLVGDDPLAFLLQFSGQIDSAISHAYQLATVVPMGDNQTLATLNDACGSDLSFLPPALDDLNVQLGLLKSHITQLADTAGCHNIAPLVRRVAHGSLCVESPYGWTVIWSCSLALCVLSFIMLTTRAALYNSVKTRKKSDKKSRRVADKEYSEYKEYMKKFDNDGNDWTMDQAPPGDKMTAIRLKFDVDMIDDDFDHKKICGPPTFDTHATTKSSKDGDDLSLDGPGDVLGTSEGVHDDREEKKKNIVVVGASPQWEEDSYASSNESDISDDSELDEEGADEEQSAMMSFIADTKSIAMQTILSIKNIRPVLAKKLTGGSFVYGGGSKRDNEMDKKVIGDIIGEEEADEMKFDEISAAQWMNMTGSSLCDDSIYLTTNSMCQHPSSPGLHPRMVLPPFAQDERECMSPHLHSLFMMDEGASDNDQNRPSFHRIIQSSTRDAPMEEIVSGKDNTTKTKPYGVSARKKKAFDGPKSLQAITPSSGVPTLTPSAPRKVFSFLSRTREKVSDEVYCHDLLSGVIPSRVSSGFSHPTSDGSVRPLKLELSPLLHRAESQTTLTREKTLAPRSSSIVPAKVRNPSKSAAMKSTTKSADSVSLVQPRAPKKAANRYGRLRFLSEGED